VLTYRQLGEGQALVCHPGGPGFSSLYFGDLAGLGTRFRLVLLDPRGTGNSPRPPDPSAYTIDDYVADLEEARDRLGFDRMLLLGHSHGGVVAQAYAARHPERVERLILASTLPRFQAEQEGAMRGGMEARRGEPWYAAAQAALEAEQAGQFTTDAELAELVWRELPLYFAHFAKTEAAYLEELKAESPNADALRLFNLEVFPIFDLRPELPRISAPTLVITGTEDFICGPLCADEIAASIGDVQTLLVPGAGHFVFVERPVEFATAITKFLGEPAPRV
jgi:pimeloyl-ACP methyl ester carboxylesterase